MTTQTLSSSTVAARPVRYGRETSAVLFAAFTLSAAHTCYLTVTGLAGDFSAASPTAWAFYAVGFGLAVLVRRDRRWAIRLAAALLTALLAVALFVYPTTFEPRQQNVFGWFENDVYTGLLMIALYLTGRRLGGRTLQP